MPRILLGSLPISLAQAQRIQKGADAGEPDLAQYRNPIAAAAKILPQRGFARTMQIYPPVDIRVEYAGKQYDVYLAQPPSPRHESIWLIVGMRADGSFGASEPNKGNRHAKTSGPVPRLPVGLVTYPPKMIQRIRARVDRGDPAFKFYSDPVQVVARSLSKFGFRGPVHIEPELEMKVMDRAHQFDVQLVQPVRKGITGIWLIRSVGDHEGEKDSG